MFSGNILQRIPYFSRTDQENYASAEDVQLRLGDNCLLIADNKLVLDGSMCLHGQRCYIYVHI